MGGGGGGGSREGGYIPVHNTQAGPNPVLSTTQCSMQTVSMWVSSHSDFTQTLVIVSGGYISKCKDNSYNDSK